MQRILTTDLTYPGDLTPAMKRTLAALAAVEDRFEADRECLTGWTGPDAVRQKLMAELEVSHARHREPLVQKLAQLHQQHMEALVGRAVML